MIGSSTQAGGLRDAIAAECGARSERRRIAGMIQNTAQPLELERPRPELRFAPKNLARLKHELPVAASREPCARCATRGDLGCRHQRPFGSAS